MERLTPKPPIPTYNEVSGYAVTFVLQTAIVAAIINLLWNGYHYRRTQSSINGAYVVVLFVTEDAVQKGIVADNVAETRSLSRDVQGNLEASKTVLKGLEEDRKSLSTQVGQLRKIHIDLAARVVDLEAIKMGLQNTNKDLQNTKTDLQNITRHLGTQVGTLGTHLNILLPGEEFSS